MVVDEGSFRQELENLLADQHTRGVIRPATVEEEKHAQYWVLDPEMHRENHAGGQ